MSRMQVGLVGYGFHGQTLHQAAKQAETLEIVAVLEPDGELHKKIHAAGATAYLDSDAFFSSRTFEAVIVASPVATHRTLVTRAVAAGVAIGLEKPMALTYWDSLEIATMAGKAGIRLMVGMTTHYRPEMVFAGEQLQTGVIGEVHTIHEEIVIGLKPFPLNYVAEENGGGVLLENGIHMLDHLLWLGGPINRLLSATKGGYFLGGYHEDTAMLHLVHNNGVVSMGHLQWMPYKEAGGFCLKIYGTLGCLTVHGLDRVEVNVGGELSVHRFYGEEGDYIDKFGERHLPGVVAQLQDFAAFVRGIKEPEVSVAHVLEAHRWLDEAYRIMAK